MADPSPHFLRTTGRVQVNDTTNQVTVTATESSDQKLSLSASWRIDAEATTSDTMPLMRDGWFVFVEDVSRVWVFDGVVLRLLHYTDRNQSDTVVSEIDQSCPQEVRDALPESYRKR